MVQRWSVLRGETIILVNDVCYYLSTNIEIAMHL